MELENIHDPAILIEPIHRVVFGARPDGFVAEMERFFAAHGGALVRADDAEAAGQRFTLATAGGDRRYAVKHPAWPLCVGSLEAFLSGYLPAHPEARVDYIHGEAAVRELAAGGALGVLLPPFEKADLFRGVYLGGVLPKKTFSMGHAEEKRYYLECRRITR